MSDVGVFLSSEELAPREFLATAVKAEAAGVERLWISDHPWTDGQGESSFVWSVLGAIAAGAKRLQVTTAVTCPDQDGSLEFWRSELQPDLASL